jgi:pimeloyl-ACP methyl ester carboxylesterase
MGICGAERQHPTGMDEDFLVVWWEQRGSGISYAADIPPETLTMEQLIADAITVTDYLRDRFHQDRIYLMSHSGGSFIGIQVAALAPERYHAYIGVGQMSNQRESERLAYDYMLDAYRARGNTEMVAQLESAPVTSDGTPAAYVAIRDKAMHELGIGTMHDMRSLLFGLVVPSFEFREYTLREKINLWRGKSRSGISVVWDTMVATDMRTVVPTLAIPVYFLGGRWDYTCSTRLARTYFDVLQAPVKGFYTFDHSAHSPMFEEPARLGAILRGDVLTGGTQLADRVGQR